MPRFPTTYCSQCGAEFGPGDAGFSHCKDHMNTKKQQAKAAKVAAVDAAKARCITVSKAIPDALGEWGVVRTRAWVAAIEKAKHVAGLSRVTEAKLNRAADRVLEIGSIPIDQLSENIGSETEGRP
jgi:hypothetical protein